MNHKKRYYLLKAFQAIVEKMPAWLHACPFEMLDDFDVPATCRETCQEIWPVLLAENSHPDDRDVVCPCDYFKDDAMDKLSEYLEKYESVHTEELNIVREIVNKHLEAFESRYLIRLSNDS